MRSNFLVVFASLVSRSVGFVPHPAVVECHTKHILPFRATTVRKVSGSITSSDSSENGNPNTKEATFSSDDERFSLPWTDFQEWALRDNTPQYVVSVPRRGAETPDVYVMWRKLSREVVELNGYPVEMLREKYKGQILLSVKEEHNNVAFNAGILPVLDEYEFKAGGGLSGRVFGIPGVAEGSKIETASVSNVQETLPKGYVLTDDGAVAYELGNPIHDSPSPEEGAYSLEGVARSARAAADSVNEFATAAAGGGLTTTRNIEDDSMLVRLGASTAIILAGAAAVNLLSHHMTVNIFWV